MSLTVDQAEELVDAVYNYTDYRGDLEVREGYSGRGMYGTEVVAFVADSNEALIALGYALGYLAGNDFGSYPYKDLPTRVDSMGLGIVIY